jgi:glycogen phosphorylase
VSELLAELALNLRWTWNHSADELWGRLDPELWRLTQNPWVILQTVSRDRLATVSADPEFRTRLDELLRNKREAEESAGWFQRAHPQAPLKAVAYFSMEFMLSEALPIYAGGLGNVAGDQLRAASDLGVPVVGVGLLYDQGYFRQEIDADGEQQAFYPFNDPGQLPIRPLRDAAGEWLRLSIALPGTRLWIRTWEVQVGRTKLYLLDSNDPANAPAHRSITSELYGGSVEHRLKQELVLGIGGWRLLRAARIDPDVCHLNEGHAAFAVLERARDYMETAGTAFDVALAVTRAGNLFTTHTPVDAGFDRFSPALMAKYWRAYAEHALGVRFEDLLALGRTSPSDGAEPFNMAYLAINGSCAINGVSRVHGEVSRRIFQGLFPRWPRADVPVAHVTNGIHVPTWDSADADRLWEAVGGKERWRGDLAGLEERLRTVEDGTLWRLRTRARQALVTYVRECLARQRAEGGQPPDTEPLDDALDPDALTLGLARRFSSYKRPNLLLHDPARLTRILTDARRPVQLILAGKAHPQDAVGQALIKDWIHYIRRPAVRARVVFLSDYDMLMAERLVQGVDLWINTPRRPWEACGTSGMKVLVNGGLNLSELDGWWAEAYAPEVGWAIGDGQEHGDDAAWDAREADALYACLETEAIPGFYARDERGLPPAWVARMRESMARLTPRFSANRSVREYTERHYLPAAAAFQERASDRGRRGAELVAWQRELATHWPHVCFGARSAKRVGAAVEFQAHVHLGDLTPDAVRVELYADGLGGGLPEVHPMQRGDSLAGSAGGFCYSATIPAGRPAADYTPRVIPSRPGASVPLEAREILWAPEAPARRPARS